MGDNYEVPAMATVCETYLVSTLTVENVVSVLMLLTRTVRRSCVPRH
jgi:hypothetical protein